MYEILTQGPVQALMQVYTGNTFISNHDPGPSTGTHASRLKTVYFKINNYVKNYETDSVYATHIKPLFFMHKRVQIRE